MILSAIDFETTGLPLHPNAKTSLQPRAIELAVITYNTENNQQEESVWMFNPGQKIEPIITKITGITNDDLAEAPTFKELWHEIRPWFQVADVLVAHNLPFDAYLLATELNHCGELEDFTWPAALLCTAQLYEPLWGYRPKLLELYERVLGEPLDQTHRALDDVQALVDIVLKEKLHETISAIAGSVGVHIPEELRPHNRTRLNNP